MADPSTPYFGHLNGVPLGSLYRNRIALRDGCIHRPLQAGIDGGRDGAYSIVVSGGYVDDHDEGNEIIYTGQGGNDPKTKRQIADQEWVRGNAALRVSDQRRQPVRVARGHKGDRWRSPAQGYRYDGVFLVERSWEETGKDGFRICRFHLVEAPHLVADADRIALPSSVPAERATRSPELAPPRLREQATPVLERPGLAQDWVAELIASPVFHEQNQRLGGRLSAARVQAVLAWLDANGGRLSRSELAFAIELPEVRLGGALAAVMRCINLDTYLVIEDDGAHIRLDADLARAQFGVQ